MSRRRTLTAALATAAALSAGTAGAAAQPAGAAAAPAGSGSVALAEDPTWVTTASAGSPAGQIVSLSAHPGGVLHAVDNDWGVISSRNGGLSWEYHVTQPLHAFRIALAMADAQNGWASDSYTLSRTSDGARSWRVVPVPFVTRSQAEWIEASASTAGGRTVLVAKHGNEFRRRDDCSVSLYKTPVQVSHNNGRTWRRSSVPLSAAKEAEFLDSQHAVLLSYPYTRTEPDRACGDAGWQHLRQVDVHVTSDGGSSWQRVFSCPKVCTATWAGQRLVVAETGGAVHTSRDLGRSFTRTGKVLGPDTIRPQYLHAVDFASKSVGYAQVYGRGTYRTADGGRTWSLDRSEVAEQTAAPFVFGDVATSGTTTAAASTSGIYVRNPLGAVTDPVRPPQLSAAPSGPAGLRLTPSGTAVLPMPTNR